MAVLVSSCVLYAAELSPALVGQLDAASPDDWISAIVILESPLDIRALDERLHEGKASFSRRYREVVGALHYNAEQTQPALAAELEQGKIAGHVLGYTRYWIENLFVISARTDYLKSLATRGDVKYMTENFRAEPILDVEVSRRRSLDDDSTLTSIDAIGATQVRQQLGITGAGTIVANLDVGVDADHPALSANWQGNFAPVSECWLDAVGNGYATPQESGGHGSHVMGTICGQAVNGQDTLTIGVAPGAHWIASNAADQGGGPTLDNDVLETYQWLIDPDANPLTHDDVPDVVQNSWGVTSSLGYPNCYDFWNTAIQNLEAAGVVCIFSAGNEGAFGLRSPAKYELTSTQVFSVGAVDSDGETPPYPIASFSSTGPSDCPPNINAIKPEIVAPGVNIYSCNSTGGYATRSGTSFSGPHVTGVVALMREACPDCDPITIKQILISSATDYGPVGADNTYGSGFLNAFGAVSSALGIGRVTGHLQTAGGIPLANVLVRNITGGEQCLSDENGNYSLALAPGSYNLSYSRYDLVPQTLNSVPVLAGQATIRNLNLSLLPAATVSGTVTCFALPAVGASVRVLNAPIPATTTNESGFYSLTLPHGTWSLRAGSLGCDSMTVQNVNVSGNTLVNFPLAYDVTLTCAPIDSFGYGACESVDIEGPHFDWLEISPIAGGPGTPSGMTGDDQFIRVPLPINFRLYGVDYDSAYICTNGFLTFDSSSTRNNNHPLPYDDLGHAVVPYWDDWYPLGGGGDVSYYHFVAADAFIVEWYNLEHFPGAPPRETFQVWLYDSATNPSPTGNSQIRFQYLTAEPASTTTVGVQSGTRANQYVYNGSLHPFAHGMSSGLAITYGGFQTVRGVLEGTVLDCFGAPADGAIVRLLESPIDSAVCDASGFFRTHLDPGVYTVRASKAPCSSVLEEGTLIASGGTTTLDLILLPPPTISGIVTDCRGGTAAGSIVSLPGTSYPTALTNGAGFYTLSVAADTYAVRADNEICSAVTHTGIIVSDGANVTHHLLLNPPPAIQGVITDCRGGVAPGAIVQLSGAGLPADTADAAGFYRFEVVPDTYRVWADNAICSSIESGSIIILDGQTLTVNLTLAAPPAISGIIIDCNGEPAANAIVTFPGSALPQLFSDPTGRYFVTALPGSYSVRADKDPCSAVQSDGNLVLDGDTTYVSLTLLPPPSIQGVITDCSGGPAASVEVVFPGSGIADAITNASGYYHVDAFPGLFTVGADNAYCSAILSAGHTLAEGETLTVNLTLRGPAAIRGIVTDCFGAPASHATLDLVAEFPISTNADSSGRYLFTVYPGSYRIRADNASCSFAESGQVNVNDGDTLIVNLTLNPPPRIQGVVTSCLGGPAQGALVHLVGTSYPPLVTGNDGYYGFDVVPGTYQVSASLSFCSAVSGPPQVVPEGALVTHNLTLAPPGSLEGLVESCYGGPGQGAMLRLLDSDIADEFADQSGFYRFGVLPAGSYSVVVTLAQCLAETAFVNITAGAPVTLGFELSPDLSFLCDETDSHGYTLCEDSDPDGPVYQWREIAPAQGGMGTVLNGLTDNNFVGPLTLPFPVKIFGATYNSYFVGSNGVVSFQGGVSTIPGCLPDANFGTAIVGYGADLNPAVSGGEVAIRHDTSSHLLVVEWSNVQRCCEPGDRVSFEIIIREFEAYPTVGADNEILVQYADLPSEGDYASVGIQGSNGATALNYLCDGNLSPYSSGLVAGRAILFSTGRTELTVDLEVNPSQVVKIMPVGVNSSDSLQICNAGTFYPLNWVVNIYQYAPSSLLMTSAPIVQIESPERRRDGLDSRGGPDPLGYSWVDSQEPDGPVYAWAEIRTLGTNTGMHSNNQYLSVPLPWPFTLYNFTYNSIFISTNGNAHFDDPTIDGFNRPIPSATSPDALLAVMYDDLSTATFGNIYYFNDLINHRFIIEWDSVGRHLASGAYSFQILLYENGPIIYQYKQLSGIVNSATVGIENRTGSVGLQVVYNANYLAQGRAIRFGTFPQWLRLPTVTSGTLPADQCTTLTLNFRASTLANGSYGGELVIQSNDADENPRIIPVELLVGVTEPPEELTMHYSQSGATLTFRWSPTGAPYYRLYSSPTVSGPFTNVIATTSATTLTISAPPATTLFYRLVGSTTP